MPSVTDEPGKGGTTPARKELNQHMHRKHNGALLTGNTWERLVAHEELHNATACDHTHEDFELPAQWQDA